jgi:ankyrin repeat protein
VELIRLLIEYGAKGTAPDNELSTPLHEASAHGRADVVRILLENGADVGARDKQGRTPLHWVLDRHNLAGNRLEVARVLLDHHADKEVQDKHRQTPLDCASPWLLEQLELFQPRVDA